MKTDWLLILLALGLVAMTGRRCDLPPTYTVKEGESLASATNVICANSGVSGLLARGRWHRFLMTKDNKALASGGTNIVVHAGESFRVPENLCAPFLYRTEIAVLVLAVLMMVRAYFRTETICREFREKLPPGFEPTGTT